MDAQPASAIADKIFSERFLKDIEIAQIDGLFEEEGEEEQTPKFTQKDINQATYQRLFGSRFADSSFENYTVYAGPQQQWVLDVCRKYAAYLPQARNMKRNTLIISGTSGTGKNHLAYSIGKSAIKQGITLEAKPFLHIMQEIKHNYSTHARSEREILDHYIHLPFLILEEIGVSFDSNTERIYLFDLLDGRYKYDKPTVILTNFSEREFREFIDFDGTERLWSRLEQIAVVLNCTWENYRARPV